MEKKSQKGGRALADALVLEPAKTEKIVTLPEVIAFIRGLAGRTNFRNSMHKTVHPIHFEDFSGQQFEWLVYALLQRQRQWDKLSWLGQTGSDGGRDIWGHFNDESYCYQCANYQKLTSKKVKDDIDKLIHQNTSPDNLVIVTGGTGHTRDTGADCCLCCD